MMEVDYFLGFPTIIEKILLYLPKQELLKCRLACQSLKTYMDNPVYWLKRMKMEYKLKDPLKEVLVRIDQAEESGFPRSKYAICMMIKYFRIMTMPVRNALLLNSNLIWLKWPPITDLYVLRPTNKELIELMVNSTPKTKVLKDNGINTILNLIVEDLAQIMTDEEKLYDKTATDENDFKCYFCSKRDKTMEAIELHVSSSHTEVCGAFQCDYCGAAYDFPTSLEHHVIRFHYQELIKALIPNQELWTPKVAEFVIQLLNKRKAEENLDEFNCEKRQKMNNK